MESEYGIIIARKEDTTKIISRSNNTKLFDLYEVSSLLNTIDWKTTSYVPNGNSYEKYESTTTIYNEEYVGVTNEEETKKINNFVKELQEKSGLPQFFFDLEELNSEQRALVEGL